MIESMKKVSIVLLNKEKQEALKKLRKLGLVHLEKIEGSSEKLNAFKEYTNNANLSESVLGEIKIPKKEKQNQSSLENEKVISLCSQIVAKTERKKQLMEEISSDATELERFANWGSVSLEDFEYLNQKNIQLKLYEVPVEKYSEIDNDIQTILVNNDKKNVRFLIVNGGEGRPEKLMPQAFEVPFPRMSTKFLEEEIKKDEQEIVQIETFFKENIKYLDSIKKFKKDLEKDIEFENVNAGMQNEGETETSLAWITGFVPSDDIQKLIDSCKQNNWALAYEDAQKDDSEVPTKLKNNKFVSLIYPLTDFLGTVPGYNEYDISGWFLLFFTVFFGMIFGDGGYGLLVSIVSLLLIFKSKIAKKPVQPLLMLALLVGGATVVWGIVTCTWFGIPVENLPSWLKNISIPLVSNAYSEKIWQPFWVTQEGVGLSKDQNLQIFCFALALIQLSIAHIKAAKRNIVEKNPLKALGDVGSLLQLVGMFWIVLSMVVNSKVFVMLGNIGDIPVGKIEVSLIAVGFVMSFIFSNYDGNIGKSILESCKNIISVLLGVVNVFSDIVSYIRLWAVGLAGAAISDTVNTMAGPILGHAILFIAAIALLVFGHGLNMVLNLLSVIVHGVRLNTLEFSTHLGVSWSGKKYEPFSENK
ncbi:MAG: ATPase [Spirochaetia bacterium]|nr:ATPase [Spirochaetia bacterium]